MKIKQGYKQTDIGVIPEDWEVKTIDDCFEISAGGDVDRYNFSAIRTKSHCFPIFSNSIENKGLYGYTSRPKYKNNSITITGRGNIGKSFYRESEFDAIVRLLVLEPKKLISSKFICEFLTFKPEFKIESTGVPQLTAPQIYDIKIPYPKPEEQQAIASTLSDIDSLIESLNKKIAKKRAIKEGTMQQLLTGKKRLAGFSEDWVEKKLGEIGEIVTGRTPSRNTNDYWGNEFDWISAVDFKSKYILNSKEKLTKLGKQTCRVLPKNSVLVTCIASIGLNAIVKVECATNQQINAIICNSNNDCEFIYYQISANKNRLLELAGQTAVPIITKSEFENFTINVPNNLKEQQSIAQILTDMDSEIEQLEKERQKYTALKQGAMQKLLTGQIRLVNTSSQHRTIPIDAHIIGGHIVYILHGSKGWGRTKLQKSMHLLGYCCQLDFGNEYIRNVAGPDDQKLMKHIDDKFKQYGHVRREVKKDDRGGKHYDYIPTPKIVEIEQAFEHYPIETKQTINDLLNKIKKMDLKRAEIVSTLYAVWNNRIIKEQEINDDLLLKDFYDWSEHKSDFSQDLVLRGLNYMRKEDIIPIGWGKYIDKK